jgi:hypothetical protein
MHIIGMYGIGDCLHARAVYRELMKKDGVTLEGFYPAIVHDLIDRGLEFIPLDGGRLQPRIKAGDADKSRKRMARGAHMKLTYSPDAIKAAGSILAAQFKSCGLTMPEKADFSLPVPDGWRNRARTLISTWSTNGKPVLVYRPIVQNKVWECPSRSPDPVSYSTIFRAIRDKFFVVSVADLTQQEWIIGPEETPDVTLHNGELDFETLAGLFAEAALVFCNPGFTPVLAQAVGTPSIIVYGGNESFRTTNSVGAHLAPTLAIEPDHPCECHARTHNCDKTITLPPAIERVLAFAERFA